MLHAPYWLAHFNFIEDIVVKQKVFHYCIDKRLSWELSCYFGLNSRWMGGIPSAWADALHPRFKP